MKDGETLFQVEGFRALRFERDNLAPVQIFLEANPAYSMLVNGAPARSNEAELELTEIPDQIRPDDAYFLGFWDAGELIGVVHVMRTWPVPGISHVGLFQIAELRQGTGVAATLFRALEAWMIAQFDPRWLRLGVVGADDRGQRFWRRMGFHETGRKQNVRLGVRTHELVVMIKAIHGEDDEVYRQVAAAGPIALETPARPAE